jgi:hypothetical protein
MQGDQIGRISPNRFLFAVWKKLQKYVAQNIWAIFFLSTYYVLILTKNCYATLWAIFSEADLVTLLIWHVIGTYIYCLDCHVRVLQVIKFFPPLRIGQQPNYFLLNPFPTATFYAESTIKNTFACKMLKNHIKSKHKNTVILSTHLARIRSMLTHIQLKER